MNRKLLSIICIAILLLATLFVLSACSAEQAPEPHVCQFVKKDTVAPTCTNEGYTRYICGTCNKEIRRDITTDPDAHKYVKVSSVDPKCTKDAEDNVISTSGYDIKRCERCGDYSFAANKTQPEHAWDEGTLLYDYGCDGLLIKYTCSVCGIEEQKLVENHVVDGTIVGETVAPTYYNSGYTVYYCSCHKAYTKSYVAPLSEKYLTFELFNDYQFSGGSEAYGVKGNTYISASDVIIPYEYMGVNVTKIATSAFQHAKNVKSITLTTNIEYISDLAFYGAEDLEKIVFVGTIKEWKTIVENSGKDILPEHWADAKIPNNFDDAMTNDYFYIECSDGRLYLDGCTMLLWDAYEGEYVSFVPADVAVGNK